jgi:3-oxoadipate enol-lactonase
LRRAEKIFLGGGRKIGASGGLQRSRREMAAMQKTIDGIRIGYDDAGSGDVLVLIHGFPLDRTTWEIPAAALAKSCRVIRPDLRGLGESARGEGPALMETLAGDLAGLLDALGVERSIVVGHSLGTYVALAFFRMYSERVAGLGFVAGHVSADTPALLPVRDLLASRLASDGMQAAIDSYLPRYFAPAFYKEHADIVAGTVALMKRQDPLAAAAIVVGIKERVGSEDLLEDIAVPTVIVAGEKDEIISAAALERTSAAIADCEFVLIPGVGHMLMDEAPAITTAAIERLVARCGVEASAR